jgi:hypothetical protein
MTDKTPYSYIVLRYVHDVTTGEFVNVGVVLSVPSQRKLLTKMRTTISRIKGAFPDLERSAFTSLMHSVQRSLQKISDTLGAADLLLTPADAATYAREAVPIDDSSLQWGPVGSGLTENPEATFERLYGRLVARYDTRAPNRRTDDDVWRPVRQQLEERHLDTKLQVKTIRGRVDEIVFRHAWKNGRWHVYEPVSFDLADAEGIKTKAREWFGHLSAVVVGGDAEPFQPHFIVGQPCDEALQPAYKAAIAILRSAPNEPEIFSESDVDQLVSQIEDEVRSHGA